MAATRINGEESVGLVVAVLLHVALLAVLLFRPPEMPIPVPERIEVTISDDVGLTSASPDPYEQAAPDIAPELGEAPAAPEELLPETPDTTPPLPVPEAQPQPRPTSQPAPKPTSRPVPKPKPQPAPKPSSRPAPKPSAKPTSQPAPRATSKPSPKPAEKSGGSRVGSDFLEGSGGTSGTSASQPAAAIGPAVQSSLRAAITRQIKPHWTAPQGPDVEKIVTILSFELNEDGSLAGKPVLEDQRGVTDVNRAQAYRHAEQAIRAVELAAPFNLPPQYYSAWKRIKAWRFDRRLSQ
ncbi:MAG: hypothetical protein KDE55_04505 [Novosphingobium sp.]|nr:hypothetical protein [Novosphingobium sp.]